MKQLTIILTMLLTVPTLTFGQTTDQLFQKADSAYFDYKDYQTALDLYKKIKGQLKSTDKDYAYAVNKIAMSLFNLVQKARDKNIFSKSIELSSEFIDLIDKEGKYIDSEVVKKKYFMYKNIIVAYFGLEQRDKAKPYQQKLYDAYKKKQLPEGIDQHYNFEKFVYNDQNVWGYEWFEELPKERNSKSFSKIIYYIYSRDSVGGDKEQLFTLQTVMVHKFKGNEPDYVLTKRTYNNNNEQSETIWTYTFDNPIDYEKLHNAIVEFLKAGVKTDTKSIIKPD